jgi:Rho GTPase-activating protein SYDE
MDFENVKDIHLVTGLLKQFLRDLPEPLCTVSRYSSMVETFRMCLPFETCCG